MNAQLAIATNVPDIKTVLTSSEPSSGNAWRETCGRPRCAPSPGQMYPA